ncbi:MAG: HAMP domain-containing sensor histidine kinase [Candidatus Omnitrophota bacterium]
MRIKIVLIFILSVLIPTALLAFWGFQAVRSEKAILESNIRRVYESMADVVEDEIKSALAEKPKPFLKDPSQVESVLTEQASLFQYQVKILDRYGKPLGGKASPELGAPVLRQELKGLPYTIAVYEKYPVLIKGLEGRKSCLALYVAMIFLSALSVLGGSFFTLGILSREWRLTQLKSEFVASLSHDLRRPLTSIRMFSEMLKNNSVPTEEKKQEYYHIISNQSEQLTDLANNILDFARIERGRKQYEFRTEEITPLVRNAVERFKASTVQESYRISLNMDPDIPALKVDAEAISRAITNLLANAVKYSPVSNEIKVNVVKKPRAVVIEVMDHGIGIARREQKKIFEKFYRVPQKETNVEGSGLGLALVKHAVQAHHGKILVESTMGQGSKFTLVLPVNPDTY